MLQPSSGGKTRRKTRMSLTYICDNCVNFVSHLTRQLELGCMLQKTRFLMNHVRMGDIWTVGEVITFPMHCCAVSWWQLYAIKCIIFEYYNIIFFNIYESSVLDIYFNILGSSQLVAIYSSTRFNTGLIKNWSVVKRFCFTRPGMLELLRIVFPPHSMINCYHYFPGQRRATNEILF